MARVLRLLALGTLFALGGCAKATTPACPSGPAVPLLDATTVCTHLAEIRCTIDHDDETSSYDACLAAYANAAAASDPGAFARTVNCYVEARSCRRVAECSLACTDVATDAGADAGADSSVDSGFDAGADAGDADVDAGDADVDAGP